MADNVAAANYHKAGKNQMVSNDGVEIEPGEQERFSLIDPIGCGSAGLVYKAWDYILDKPVALKMLQVAGEGTNQLFAREVRIAQQLSHPNIVRIHDLVLFQGRPCISMEFIDGPSLADVISQKGALSVDNLIALAVDICEGLKFAHEHSVVHRDLKPANILLDKDRARIVDF